MLQGHRWDKRECPMEMSRPGDPSPLPSRILGSVLKFSFQKTTQVIGVFM